ncbi:MAG: PocR ligand-binding domain-containing protein [Candidatus Omnitrophota bacterium]
MTQDSPQRISLTDLIPLGELQEMQDSFSEVANVAIRIVDLQGHFLTTPSNQPSLCVDVSKESRMREIFCNKCLPMFLGGEGIVDDDFSFECLPGLQNYLVPLKVMLSQDRSLLLGYMVIGPFIFLKRKEKEEYKAIAEESGLESDQLWNMVLELRVFSYKAIHSFLDMIANLTGHILNLAYTKLVMQRKIFKDRTPLVPSGALSLKKTDEFLELFLDLMLEITNANTGSVMLLDRSKKQLIIKAARGLAQDVIARTAQKVGEGVAGLVTQTKKPCLINDENINTVVERRQQRPQLFSSAIVPLKHNSDVYGVLSVSSQRDLPVKFDSVTLSVLTKAASIASMTLERFEP